MAERTVTVRLSAEISRYKAAMAEAASATRQAASNSQSAWDTVSNTALGAGAAITAGIGMAVKKYADFDAAMSNVKAATHASAQDMELLRNAAIKAGADTAYSGEEAARGIEELAKAGVSTKDILNGGLNGALALAAAGQMDVGDAAEVAASAMTQFGLKGSDVGHVADLLAAGAGKAQGSVGDLGAALNQSGLVASQAGISIEEATGTLAAFASAGLVGSDAGTSFKTMLQRLQNPSKEAKATMDDLGISMYDSKGNFVGMANLAEQLKTSMEGLTPAQRDAAMATIFGSDAVRAANVLYAQGGAGIQDWINKVNDTGYAAETAAAKQDNLRGDLEKLGGAFDTVFLKSGSGMNDFLRTMTQGFTNLVEIVGQVPAPVLGTVTAIGAVAGAGLLAVGGVMKLVSSFNEFRNAADDLNLKMPGLDGNLGKVARSLSLWGTAAAVAYQTISTIGQAVQSSAIGFESLDRVMDKSGHSIDALNIKFAQAEWAQNASMWTGGVQGINNIGDAVTRLAEPSKWETMNAGVARFFGYETSWGQMQNDVSAVDQALANMVTSGNMEGASQNFEKISESARKSGASAEQLIAAFPQLSGAVQDYAASLGVSLTPQETLDAMMGNLPPKLAEAAGGASQAAAGLGEMGAAAETAAAPLKDIVDAMTALGMAQMSMTEAQGAYSQSVRDLGAALAENVFQLNANGTAFDVTTESGYKAQQAFNAVAQAGFDMVESMANNGATQGELQGALQQTYNDLVNSATQFGLTAEQADVLARATLGIPPNVDIETWMSENAKNMAESTDKAVDNIPDSDHVDSSMSPNAENEANNTRDAVNGIPNSDHVDSSMSQAARNEADNTTRAVNGIPGGHHTDSSMSSAARTEAGWTHTAVGDIPNSKYVDLTAGSAARDMANDTTNAINNIPSFKEIRINTINTSSTLGQVAKRQASNYRGGLPGSSMGANLRGFYRGGGLLPGTPPANSTVDNLQGYVVDTGEPVLLRSREFIMNEKATAANFALLQYLNNGGKMRGFATGGQPAKAFVPGQRFQPHSAQQADAGLRIEQLVMNTPQATDPDHYATRASQTFARQLQKVVG